MHLIEQYALSCGVKIGQPHIEPLFFPVEFDKYITLHASSGMTSKNYDYFTDVIELILPYLKEKNIKIIQIGGADDPSLPNCTHYHGRTSIRQTSYLIQKSLLHVGNDSFSTHVASGFDKKIVSLYSVLYKECCGPYWGNKKNQILLESNRNGLKPSFSNNESPKMVNLIKPETIACSILDLLDIEHKLANIKTIHIGSEYHKPSLSVIPNHIMPKSFASGQPVNIWGHYCFDEQNITRWAYDRKCNIFLNQPMKLKYLKLIKPNINAINYYVSESDDQNYFLSLERLGIKLNLLSKDSENINSLRMKFFDWNINLIKTKTKKDLDNYKELCNNSFYKCSMKIISDSKTYSSKAAWKHGESENFNRVIDCPEFWEDLNILRIYNES